MVATLYKFSLLRSTPFLSNKPNFSPSLTRFSNPTRVRFAARKHENVVAEASMSISESNSRPSVLVNSEKINSLIVMIDNYDSFTYNLYQYMGELGCEFEVYRNDELTVEELKRKNPRRVLISPDPGTPQDSGISLQMVLELRPSVPLFGVCMGQCIGEAFGVLSLSMLHPFKLTNTSADWYRMKDCAFAIWCNAWEKFHGISRREE